jgi:hypothetical protein
MCPDILAKFLLFRQNAYNYKNYVVVREISGFSSGSIKGVDIVIYFFLPSVISMRRNHYEMAVDSLADGHILPDYHDIDA